MLFSNDAHTAGNPRVRRLPSHRLRRLFCLIALVTPLAPHAALAQDTPSIVQPAEQREVLEQLIDVLTARYVFPEMAAHLADSLRSDLSEGRHSGPLEPSSFADLLSGRIREISGDGHLWVAYDEAPARRPKDVPDADAPDTETAASPRHPLARSNFGLPRAEVLPGNVGYLDIRQFASPEVGGDAAAAAMAFLANVDALILDVRQSMGGSARMVELLASYLFEGEPVHLFDIYLRPADRIEQRWTLPYLPSPRLADQPVYVLTRASTFSAGEGLAYILKHQGRATVVGENTAGGANPGGFHRLNERFVAFVAEARVTSPVTGSNWEGTGVAPHVESPSHLALDRAHLLALQRLRESEAGAEGARELDGLIEKVRERLRRERGIER